MFNIKSNRAFFVCLAQLALGIFWQTNAFAGFGVMEEEDVDYYGSANIAPFKEAVDGTESLSTQDRAFLEGVEQVRIINRWYVRALFGQPSVEYKEITGTVSLNDETDFEIPFDRIKDDLFHLLLAGGYRWENWSFEVEPLLSKRLRYQANPLSDTIALQADINIRQYALFFNFQYVLPHRIHFYPQRLQLHFDAGFGPVYKNAGMVVASLEDDTSSSQTENTLSLAGNLGVGARYQFTSNILLDVIYRYFHMGTTNFGPANNGFEVEFKANKTKTSNFFLGLTYQF